jgi:hypothetical protein
MPTHVTPTKRVIELRQDMAMDLKDDLIAVMKGDDYYKNPKVLQNKISQH